MEIQLRNNLLLIKKHKNTKFSEDMVVEENDEDKNLITGEVMNAADGDFKKGDTVIFGKYALLTLMLQGEKYHVLETADVIGTCDYRE
jgi:co-chaperonin GroES (HSP10)